MRNCRVPSINPRAGFLFLQDGRHLVEKLGILEYAIIFRRVQYKMINLAYKRDIYNFISSLSLTFPEMCPMFFLWVTLYRNRFNVFS